MSRQLIVVLLLALTLAGPARAQEEPDEGSFSITTNATYAPGQTPQVSVWTENVHSLEFRLYRVNDPVKFFTQLREMHSYGGRAPRPGRSLTWIEHFHAWKHSVWAWFRDLVRAQFTADSREKIRQWQAERETPVVRKPEQQAGNAQTYAQIPVLNQQQVVAVWNWNAESGHNRWESQMVTIPAKEAGVYLVEATDGKLRAYTIVIISEMAVITKTASGQVVNFVVERKSGTPVANAETLLWIDGEEKGRSRTDANGLAAFTVQTTKRPDDVAVLVTDGKRFAVNTPGGWSLGTSETDRLHSYAYTERPVYRPGDIVHFKFIVRSRTRTGYEVPKPREVRIELHDAEGDTKLQKTVTTSDTGSFSGDYAVPADAALGYWYMSAESDDAHLSGATFYVEEYKKPEYQVRVTPGVPRVLQGQSVKATIDARYYFGEPVANAKVTWVVHHASWWAPGRYVPDSDEDFGSANGEGEDEGEADDRDSYAGEEQEEHTGTLDAEGKLEITVPTRLSKGEDERYRIEARVTDAGNREISGAGTVYATYGSFWVDASPDSYLYKQGSDAVLTVRARDYDGKAVATPVHVEVTRWSWHDNTRNQVMWSGDATTDSHGDAQLRYRVTEPGSLLVRVTAVTPEKRTVSSNTYIYVPGGSDSWGQQEEGEKLRIVTDKKEYAPGDTAHVVVTVPPGASHLLVTVESSYLFSYQVARAHGGSVAVDVPVRKEYAPNVFITAAYIQENKFYSGSKTLKVPAREHALDVQLTPSKAQFQPGEAAVYTLTARDAFGKPVRGEFTFGVVDEAIYAIRPDSTPLIQNDFYGPRYDEVQTETSLTYYFNGQAGKRSMQLANLRPSRNLGQLKPERLVEPKIRKAFPDTAYWNADVRTDAAGKAQIKFDFPDALTTWRATVRGLTADTKVGSAVEKVIVRKNLLVRLVVPRFFRQGDELTVSTIVHNYLTSTKKVRVQMDFDGVQVIDGATRDLDVASRGEIKADWRVRVTSLDKVRVLGKALTNEESDAMELTLPAQPFGVKLSESRSGSIAGDGEQKDSIAFPATAQSGTRRLAITVSPSVAGAVFSALDFLTSYPYGCTEQTMSSFLPNVVVGKALKDIGIKSNVDPVVLNKQVGAGLDRLYDYQHESGGWGWWKTDDDNEFMTAYVVAGLAQAKEAGFDVRDDALQKGRKWLATQSEANGKLNPDLRAYVAYALALSARWDANGPSANDAIKRAWDDRNAATPYGLAVLGLAQESAGDGRSADIADMLEKQVKQDGQSAWWESQKDWLLDFWGDSSPEATAFAVKLLSHVRPKSPLLPKAAIYLVAHRDSGYYWTSTKQTAMVIFGLTDYVRATGELNANFTAQVYVGDKQVLTQSFSAKDFANNAVVRVADAQLADTNNIRVTKSGSGRLYWSARAEYYTTDQKFINTGSFQLSATREYFLLSPKQTGEKVVYALNPMPPQVSVGDTIAVRITVGGSDWRYLMIEDPIPAGTESITRDDLYQLDSKPVWWNWWYTNRELRDDRTTFFETYFSRGSHEFVYLLKVVNPGVFRVSPTRVEPMYQPQYMATTESKVVNVK